MIQSLKRRYQKFKIQKIINQSGYFFLLDEPTSPVQEGYGRVSGVFLSNSLEQLDSLQLSIKGQGIQPLNLHKRPDFEFTYPGIPVIGFSAVVENVTGSEKAELNISNSEKSINHNFEIGFNTDNAESFKNNKKKKLDRIRSIIICPQCQGSLDDKLNCAKCDKSFPANNRWLNFLPSDFKNSGGAHADPISANQYDWRANEILEKYKDGLILDNGSGLRTTYRENVVNFEIADFASTDVLGVGEHLPFKDNSFDAVFSFSVLEHVRDPFQCAREITRVLKPGGEFYARVPFMQPFHGYPNHYYNMTTSGLRNLFDSLLEVKEVGVEKDGHPMYALSWYLNSWSAGLTKEDAVDFKTITLGEIMNPSPELKAKLTSQLDVKKREELSYDNFILGKKS